MLTPSAHDAMVTSLRLTLIHLEAHRPPACCRNCDHFKDGTCSQFGAVPEEFQQQPGCPAWQEEIPF